MKENEEVQQFYHEVLVRSIGESGGIQKWKRKQGVKRRRTENIGHWEKT